MVTLDAIPAPMTSFTGWLGPCTGTGSSCSFVVSGPTTVTATFAPPTIGSNVLDIDGNNQYDALTDGLLAIRYLLGLTGPDLVDNAVGSGATRSTSTDVETYLLNVEPRLDIDCDGVVDAMTDGVLIIRSLFGLSGPSLISDAIGPDARRDTVPLVETYLETLRPQP